MCARYGGYVMVEKLTKAAVGAVVADCRISHFFAATLSDKDGKRAPHLVDCLTKQVAVILGCQGIRYDVDNAGARCLGMLEAHRSLSIRNQDMDVFIEDLVAVLQSAGVAQPDIDAIAPGILALRGDIVTNSAPGNGKTVCDAASADGSSGDAAAPDSGIKDAARDAVDAGGDQ
jgi:hypothetical protein